MAYTTSQAYKNIIYSQDSQHKIKIWFNNVELEDADSHCEKITRDARCLPNDGKKIFSLSNFMQTSIEVILRDIDTSIIKDQVKISIGTLINEETEEYEYIPLGVFNIANSPTTDQNKTTLELVDNRVKLEFNYNAQPLIEQNGGKATKKQILNDICSKGGIESLVTTFYGENDEIGIYDNTIKAYTYISYIAEQSGAKPIINRDGKLDFIYFNNLSTHRIPLSILETGFQIGDPYTIKRVVYESGIIKYETSNNEELDTLYLNSANPYIDRQAQVDNIFTMMNNFTIDSVATKRVLGDPSIDSYDIIEVYDDSSENEEVVFRTLANTSFTYNGVCRDVFTTEIGKEERKENVSINTPQANKKWAKTEIDNLNGEVKILAGDMGDFKDTIQISNTVDGNNHLYLEDCSKTQIINYDVEGNSFQNGTPSVENPQEVQTITGITNFLNVEEWKSYRYSNSLPNQITDYIDINNSSNNSINFTINHNEYLEVISNPIKLEPNTQFTLNYERKNSQNINSRYYIYNYNNGTYTINHWGTDNNKGLNYTFTTDSNGKIVIGFGVNNQANGTSCEVSNIIIEKGNKFNQYVPYGTWLPIKDIGKNMFNLENSKYETLSTEDGITATSNSTVRCSDYINVFQNKTYTISSETNDIIFRIFKYGLNKEYIGNEVISNPSTFVNYTTDNDTHYIRLQTNITYIENNFMLEQGNEKTEYEPYQENEILIDMNVYENGNIVDNYELCRIGNIYDELNIDNIGNVTITKRIKKVILDGSENWNHATPSRSAFSLSTFTDKLDGDSNFISDKFFYKGNAQQQDLGYAMSFNTQQYKRYLYIQVPTDVVAIQDSDGFKQWLSDNITTLYYPLEEEYTENIGSCNLILFKGTNHLYLIDDLETNTSITYYRDTIFNGTYVTQNTFSVTNNETKSEIRETKEAIGKNTTDISSLKQTSTSLEASVKSNSEDLSEVKGNLELKIDKNNTEQVVSAFNLAVNQVVINSDKFTLDELGNIVCYSALLRGGNIKLQDNGTPDGASIQIETVIDGVTRTTSYSGYGIESNIISDFSYTKEDVEYVRNKLINNQQFTQEEISKYDVNKDGNVTSKDFVMIQKYVLSGITKNNPGKFILDTHVVEKNIQLLDGYDNEKVSIGLEGIDIAGVNINPHTKGDILYYSSALFNGHVTSSTSQVIISIPTIRSLDNIESIKCTNFNVELRGIKGYLNNISGMVEYVDKSGYSITCEKSSEGLIKLKLTKSSEFTNTTNNTPITANGTVYLELN